LFRTIDQHKQAILEFEFHKRTAAANNTVIGLTMAFMVGGFFALYFNKTLFMGRNVSSLGESAVLMIIVNCQAWPIILEKI